MRQMLKAIARSCARPFNWVPAAYWLIVTSLQDLGAGLMPLVRPFIWLAVMAWRLLRFALSKAWRYRRPLTTLGLLAGGAAVVYAGVFVLPLKSPQEVAYDKAMVAWRYNSDPANQSAWYSLTEEAQPDLQQSLMYYDDQKRAGFFERILYGPPSDEYAAEAYLKLGVIQLMTANSDQQLVRVGKELLEKAVELNPGIPFARDLIAGTDKIDRLAIESLAAERDLELLYQQNPDQRSKPNKPSQGKGKGNSENKNQQNENGKKQNGPGDKPNPKPGKPNQQSKQPSPSEMNQMLIQNMQDVKNGTGNDGI